jgi:hypothetical protein
MGTLRTRIALGGSGGSERNAASACGSGVCRGCGRSGERL